MVCICSRAPTFLGVGLGHELRERGVDGARCDALGCDLGLAVEKVLGHRGFGGTVPRMHLGLGERCDGRGVGRAGVQLRASLAHGLLGVGVGGCMGFAVGTGIVETATTTGMGGMPTVAGVVLTEAVLQHGFAEHLVHEAAMRRKKHTVSLAGEGG